VTEYALHAALLADIDEIWEYIAKDSVDAADRATETIFENIGRFAASPQLCRAAPRVTPKTALNGPSGRG
jgi:plasmid stabilization system protein ParE